MPRGSDRIDWCESRLAHLTLMCEEIEETHRNSVRDGIVQCKYRCEVIEFIAAGQRIGIIRSGFYKKLIDEGIIRVRGWKEQRKFK